LRPRDRRLHRPDPKAPPAHLRDARGGRARLHPRVTGAARTGERAERGWMLRTLENDALRLEVLAERGATIVSLRDARTGHELLWRPRWGIPHRDRIELPGSSEAVAMGHYAGGWNTLFPNAGAASTEHGVEWPMHGEVWLAPFDL